MIFVRDSNFDGAGGCMSECLFNRRFSSMRVRQKSYCEPSNKHVELYGDRLKHSGTCTQSYHTMLYWNDFATGHIHTPHNVFRGAPSPCTSICSKLTLRVGGTVDSGDQTVNWIEGNVHARTKTCTGDVDDIPPPPPINLNPEIKHEAKVWNRFQ